MNSAAPAWVNGLKPAREAYRNPLIPGSDIEAWHVPLIFEDWVQPEGAAPLTWYETYGKTQVTGDDGERSIAEIEIVRRLSTQGYQAYLVDAFGAMPYASCQVYKSPVPLHSSPLVSSPPVAAALSPPPFAPASPRTRR